jgi:hypothetical protein
MNNDQEVTMEESRSDLSKYYKQVIICKICNKEFGSDLSSRTKLTVCPVCCPHGSRKFQQ